jgi:PASTA domain
MRYQYWSISLAAAAALAGGCGGTANRVPDVEGQRLDLAQERLDDAGLGYEVIGGGALGVVVRSNWQVCEQRPAPGKRAKSVDLHVARSCAGSRPFGAVPYVVGLELDEAKRRLERRGLDYDVEEGGLGEVVVDSNWTVCDQWPYSGERSSSVQLYVEHFCDDDDYYEDDDDDDF